MNLIVIVLDSFRQDYVSTYHKGTPAFEGIAPCQTPNIDQFARSVSFLRTPTRKPYPQSQSVPNYDGAAGRFRIALGSR